MTPEPRRESEPTADLAVGAALWGLSAEDEALAGRDCPVVSEPADANAQSDAIGAAKTLPSHDDAVLRDPADPDEPRLPGRNDRGQRVAVFERGAAVIRIGIADADLGWCDPADARDISGSEHGLRPTRWVSQGEVKALPVARPGRRLSPLSR